jgi:myosin heavy subunit
MANLVHLTSYSADGAAQSQETSSALEQDQTYYDPITQEEHSIIQMTPEQKKGVLITKSALLDMQNKGELSGSLRAERVTDSGPPKEWDHVCVNLSSYGENKAKAWSIIKEAMQHPAINYTKNQGKNAQGKDRFTEVDIKGNRATIDWGIHADAQSGEQHGHIYTHRYAVDPATKKISQRASLEEKVCLDAQLKQINRALIENGLAPLEHAEVQGLNKNPVRKDIAHEQAAAATQVITQETTPESIAAAISAATPTGRSSFEVQGDTLRSLSSLQDRNANLIQEFQRNALLIQDLSKAEEFRKENEQIKTDLSRLNLQVEQRGAQIEQLTGELAVNNEQIENLHEEKDKLIGETMRLSAAVVEARDKVDEQVKELEYLQTEKQEVDERLAETESKLAETVEQVEALAGSLEVATTKISGLESKVETLQAEKTELQAAQEAAHEAHEAELARVQQEREAERAALAEKAAQQAEQHRTELTQVRGELHNASETIRLQADAFTQQQAEHMQQMQQMQRQQMEFLAEQQRAMQEMQTQFRQQQAEQREMHAQATAEAKAAIAALAADRDGLRQALDARENKTPGATIEASAKERTAQTRKDTAKADKSSTLDKLRQKRERGGKGGGGGTEHEPK